MIKTHKQNPHSHFYSSHLFKCKCSQAQIITTVLLILISIGAIAVVSVFIFNLVKENLGGTECFKTVGQFEIKSGEEGKTCFESKKVYVTIERGQGDFNLTGLSITAENEAVSETYKVFIDSTKTSSQLKNYAGGNATIPDSGEKRSYKININSGSLSTDVSKITVVPMIGSKFKICEEGKTEAQVFACE